MATSEQPISDDVARVNFAAWVDRALRRAADNGMTQRDIAAKSAIATSTFQRWRTGEWSTPPKVDKIRTFCVAVGADLGEALRALGISSDGRQATPEPELPDDVRVIMRRLADPSTPAAERDFIRQSLAMLADRIGHDGRRLR